jgi:hypothetical protein
VLKEDEIARLIEGYQNGKTVYQLAAQFGVHRVTVGVILKRNGVEIRRRGCDESQRAEVARLRGEGMATPASVSGSEWTPRQCDGSTCEECEARQARGTA